MTVRTTSWPSGCRASATAHPRAIVIAEDERKLRRMVRPQAAGGWGLDAIWADDFHHHVRRLLAGDRESYFARYTGTVPDIARTVACGWFFRRTDENTIEEVRVGRSSGRGRRLRST